MQHAWTRWVAICRRVAEGWGKTATHLKKKHDWPQSAWSKLKWHGIDVDVEGRHSSQTTVWTKLMCIHILHAVISRYQAWPLQYHFCNRWWAIATCLNYQRTCNHRELKLHWMGLLRKEHSSVFKLGLSHGLLFPHFSECREFVPANWSFHLTLSGTQSNHLLATESWWSIWKIWISRNPSIPRCD